jgi:hypothetical protein
LHEGGFSRRVNSEGAYDSICLICFAPVARQMNEAEMARLELGHVCDPGTFERYKRVQSEKETTSLMRRAKW